MMSHTGWFKSPKTQPHNWDVSCPCCARAAHWALTGKPNLDPALYISTQFQYVTRNTFNRWLGNLGNPAPNIAKPMKLLTIKLLIFSLEVRKWQSPIRKSHSFPLVTSTGSKRDPQWLLVLLLCLHDRSPLIFACYFVAVQAMCCAIIRMGNQSSLAKIFWSHQRRFFFCSSCM